MAGKKHKLTPKKAEFDPTPTQIGYIEVMIKLVIEGTYLSKVNAVKYSLKARENGNTGIVTLNYETMKRWHMRPEFVKWYNAEFSRRLQEIDPRKDDKKKVHASQVAYQEGAQNKNPRMLDIYAKMSGMYADSMTINVDNSQKTINIQTTVPRIEDITTEGLKIYKQETLNLENAAGEAKQED